MSSLMSVLMQQNNFSRNLNMKGIVNARSTDDDRDFVFDEDPYEDLE